MLHAKTNFRMFIQVPGQSLSLSLALNDHLLTTANLLLYGRSGRMVWKYFLYKVPQLYHKAKFIFTFQVPFVYIEGIKEVYKTATINKVLQTEKVRYVIPLTIKSTEHFFKVYIFALFKSIIVPYKALFGCHG